MGLNQGHLEVLVWLSFHLFQRFSLSSVKVKVKGKVFPVLNSASRHEGVFGEWRYSSTHSLTSALDGGK
jgi:hypothetical protein